MGILQNNNSPIHLSPVSKVPLGCVTSSLVLEQDSTCTNVNLLSMSNSKCNHSNIVKLWHDRLGHPHSKILNKVLTKMHLSVSKSMHEFCSACQYGKAHQFHFPLSTLKTSKPFQLIRSDIWGLLLTYL